MTIEKKLKSIAISSTKEIILDELIEAGRSLLPEDDVVGLGISWLWMLPKDHPFYPAGWDHDAAFDAKEIYLGNKTINDIIALSNKSPDKVPPEYIPFVGQKVFEIKELAKSMPDASPEVIADKFIDIANDRFYEICDRIAEYNNSNWLHLQKQIFYQIVKAWA